MPRSATRMAKAAQERSVMVSAHGRACVRRSVGLGGVLFQIVVQPMPSLQAARPIRMGP